MKVVFVLPGVDLSGGAKIALEYAAHLQATGHEVVCVCPPPRLPRLRKRLADFLRGRAWRRPDPAAAHTWDKAITIMRGRRPGTLAPDEIPHGDVIVSTWWETVEWTAALPPGAGRHVHFVQDHEVFAYLPVDRVRAAYRAPGHKVVVSRWLWEVMREEYGTERLSLVENGVDPARFVPRPVDQRTIDAGFVWSSTPRKNSQMAVEALLLARARRPGFTASVFGSEPRPALLRGLDWVTYHERPAQALIPDLYARCHVWLFPSLTEGFGLPLLEAMASGTPVVATRAGAAPQLVGPANGVLVDWSSEAMAGALLDLLDRPLGERERLSAGARAVARQHSAHSAAEAFAETLMGVVSSGR